jgi:uncharacterized protein (DUF58 family)
MREEILQRLGRRPVPIVPKRLATSQYSGEWPSPYTGKGMDFRNHRSYQLGDDLRTVHMATSVRTGKRMVIERVARRDISILIVLDCTASMSVRQKADMLLAAALMLIYSGIVMEMRVGAALKDDSGYHRLGMGMGLRHGLRLFNAVERVCSLLKSGGRPVAIGGKQSPLRRILPAGGILLYISDFLDENGSPQPYNSFAGEATGYDFVPIVVQDEFEYSFPDLPDQTLLELLNPETGRRNHVWIGEDEKRLLKAVHEQRYVGLRNEFGSYGTGFVHIKTPVIEQIQETLTRFFAIR